MFRLIFVKSDDNEADIMTKNAAATIFAKHAKAIQTGTIERWREDVKEEPSMSSKMSEKTSDETMSAGMSGETPGRQE